MKVSASYKEPWWTITADDDPYNTVGIRDLSAAQRQAGLVLDSGHPGPAEPLEIEFSAPDCIIGRHGRQALLDVRRSSPRDISEFQIEHVLTQGSDGEPFVALHEVHYSECEPAWATSVRLFGEAARWAAEHLLRLAPGPAPSQPSKPGSVPNRVDGHAIPEEDVES